MGDLNAMGFMQQKIVVDMLKGPLAQLQVFGTGKSGRQVLDELLMKGAPQLFGKDLKKEGELREGMKAIIDDSQKAQNALFNSQIKIWEITIGKLDSNNKEFLAELKGIMGVPMPKKGFANGGMVGGDDTLIPAQKGEFIVNRQSTANNIDLLRSINRNRYNAMIEANRQRYMAQHWRYHSDPLTSNIKSYHSDMVRQTNIEAMAKRGREIREEGGWNAHFNRVRDEHGINNPSLMERMIFNDVRIREHNQANRARLDDLHISAEKARHSGYGEQNVVKELNKTLSSLPHTFTHELAPVEHTHRVVGESALSQAIVGAITEHIQSLVNTRISQFINPVTGETNPVAYS